MVTWPWTNSDAYRTLHWLWYPAAWPARLRTRTSTALSVQPSDPPALLRHLAAVSMHTACPPVCISRTTPESGLQVDRCRTNWSADAAGTSGCPLSQSAEHSNLPSTSRHKIICRVLAAIFPVTEGWRPSEVYSVVEKISTSHSLPNQHHVVPVTISRLFVC